MTDLPSRDERIPESFDLEAFIAAQPVAARAALAARGFALFPSLVAWVRDAAPLLAWSDLPIDDDEDDGETRDAIHSQIGLSDLEEMRALIGNLNRVLDLPDGESGAAMDELNARYPALTVGRGA